MPSAGAIEALCFCLASQAAAAGGGGKTAGGEGIAGRGGSGATQTRFGSFVTEFQLFTPSFVKVAL